MGLGSRYFSETEALDTDTDAEKGTDRSQDTHGTHGTEDTGQMTEEAEQKRRHRLRDRHGHRSEETTTPVVP